MKRLICLALVLVLVCAAIPVWAEESPQSGTVEIQFCVGDSTLLINGEEVQVETPYVVGDGVTLVPLRVITEAFGAEVGWIEDSQTITLNYPGVEIVLQIGNPIAEVNGVPETLLAAPELPNSSTMVPLRFISESFGATVGYDEATERITVTKTATSGETVMEGAIDNAKVGDSFFKWSMDNPKDFVMEERAFDGTYTSFSYDDDNWFYIYIEPVSEDMKSFDKMFNDEKSSFTGQTLIKADKGKTDNGYDIMHFQAKDKVDFIDETIIVTDQRFIMIYSNFTMENTEIREKGIAYISTFACAFDEADDIYDLNNVNEKGQRIFESEELKLSFGVPCDYIMLSDEDAINDFSFAAEDPEDYVTEISCHVFSKSEVGSAEDAAKSDYAHNTETINETISTATPVEKASYAGLDAYQYTLQVETFSSPFYVKDVFFEMGDYVYNINISLPLDAENNEQFTADILNTFKAEELLFDEIGILLRNQTEKLEGTYEETVKDATIALPNNFRAIYDDLYLNDYTGTVFTILTQETAGMSTLEKKTFASDVYDEIKKTSDVAIIEPLRDKEVGKYKYQRFVACQINDDDEKSYLEMYMICKNNIWYAFLFTYPEIGYSTLARETTKAVMESIVFE